MKFISCSDMFSKINNKFNLYNIKYMQSVPQIYEDNYLSYLLFNTW